MNNYTKLSILEATKREAIRKKMKAEMEKKNKQNKST